MGGIQGTLLGHLQSENGVQFPLGDKLRKRWNIAINGLPDEEVGRLTTICIGDIHGNIDKLLRLWKNLECHIGKGPFSFCSIIFLGDYCDRGPDTKKVLEFLSSLPSQFPNQNHVFLAGNHDLAMAAFVDALPPSPPGFQMKETWTKYSKNKKEEGWWSGPGVENMHLQGRRWGGYVYKKDDSTFDSKSTFASYGVRYGDRAGLIAAMPGHHRTFLRNLKWVHEAHGPPMADYAGIIAVHAGLGSNLPILEQLRLLRDRDVTLPKWANLTGRRSMWAAPEEAKINNVLVVSGHHGMLETESKNRIVVDEGGGRPDMPLTAVILPHRTVVRDAGGKVPQRENVYSE